MQYKLTRGTLRMKKNIIILNLLFFFTIFSGSESFDKGIEYLDKGNYKVAEVYLLKALKEDKDKNTYFYLALIYGEQKKYDLAEENYKKAIENGSVSSLNNLAILYSQQGKNELAEEYYKKAIDSGVKDAVYNLANLYYVLDEIDLAKKYYKIAVSNGDKQAEDMLKIIDMDIQKIFY